MQKLAMNPMKSIKKSDLPSKICELCKRPFTWRKKWERDWQNVKYCSKRCSSENAKSKKTA